MYIRGLIPRISTELAESVPIDFQPVQNLLAASLYIS